MSTIGIKPRDPVLLIARNGDKHIFHTALVLSLSMNPKHAGENGQPAITAVFVDENLLRFSGSADWHKALVRTSDVVHESHPEWHEGRASLCYTDYPKLGVEDAARAAHEANRVLCSLTGDLSQPAWDDAPEWQKKSASMGVCAIITDPEITPEMLHESWMNQKLADGWTFGPVKDAEKKTHPCIIPYDGLPEYQRAKDHLFGAVVRGVMDLPALRSKFVAIDSANIQQSTDTGQQIPDEAFDSAIQWRRYAARLESLLGFTPIASAEDRTTFPTDTEIETVGHPKPNPPQEQNNLRMDWEGALRTALDQPGEIVEVTATSDNPAQVTPETIDAQNAHDRETGNLNELGQTPYEAANAEAVAQTTEEVQATAEATDESQATSEAASAEPAPEADQATA